MKNPKKRHLKKALKELTKLTAASVQLLPVDRDNIASRLGMLPNLTSTTPLSSQEAYDLLWGGIDAELSQGMGKTLFGMNPPSTPEERAERFRRSMPEGYNKHEDARGHDQYMRDSVRGMSDEVLLDMIDSSPIGLSDPGRAKDRDFTKLAVKATPEEMAELTKDLKLVFQDGKMVDSYPVSEQRQKLFKLHEDQNRKALSDKPEEDK